MSTLYRTFLLAMLLGASSFLLFGQRGSGGSHAASHGGLSGGYSSGFGPTATAPYHLPAPTTVGRPPLAGTFANPASALGNYPAYSSSFGAQHVGSYNGSGHGGSYNGSGHGSSSYGHRGRYRPYGFVGVPVFGYGYGGYPYGGDFDSSYGYSPELYGDPASMQMDAGGQSDQVQQQVQQLSAQVNELRNSLGQAQSQAQSAPVAAPPMYTAPAEPASPPSPPVTLVLKNGKTVQVQNYAVMGNLFWDFSSQPVRKIPLSNIDIPASTKATEANGAEFPALRSGS